MLKRLALLSVLCGLTMGVHSVSEGSGSGKRHAFRAFLSGYQEVPSLSTEGKGFFTAKLNRHGELGYSLRYRGLTNVTQAHIHLGQRATTGGVMVFLCSNLGTGPAGTPTCPEEEGEVTGMLSADGVLGPAAEGISPGEFDEFIDALRAGAGYVNVHTSSFAGGEIRGQIK